jgi:hypothetical protein
MDKTRATEADSRPPQAPATTPAPAPTATAPPSTHPSTAGIFRIVRDLIESIPRGAGNVRLTVDLPGAPTLQGSTRALPWLLRELGPVSGLGTQADAAQLAPMMLHYIAVQWQLALLVSNRDSAPAAGRRGHSKQDPGEGRGGGGGGAKDSLGGECDWQPRLRCEEIEIHVPPRRPNAESRGSAGQHGQHGLQHLQHLLQPRTQPRYEEVQVDSQGDQLLAARDWVTAIFRASRAFGEQPAHFLLRALGPAIKDHGLDETGQREAVHAAIRELCPDQGQGQEGKRCAQVRDNATNTTADALPSSSGRPGTSRGTKEQQEQRQHDEDEAHRQEVEALQKQVEQFSSREDQLARAKEEIKVLQARVQTMEHALAQADSMTQTQRMAGQELEAKLEARLEVSEKLQHQFYKAFTDLRGMMRTAAVVRPVSFSEAGADPSVVTISPDRQALTVVVRRKGPGVDADVDDYANGTSYSYHFDRIFFGRQAGQDNMHFEVSDMVRTMADGGHCICMAYGATGSGKTTLIRKLQVEAAKRLFEMMMQQDARAAPAAPAASGQMGISCIEVCDETVCDLLGKDARKQGCRGDAAADAPSRQRAPDLQQFLVANARVVKACSLADATKAIEEAHGRRATGRNDGRNSASSRSHALFTYLVQSGRAPTNSSGNSSSSSNNIEYPRDKYGSLTFVDLAGAERSGTADDTKGINNGLYYVKEMLMELGRQNRPSTQAYNKAKAHALTRILAQLIGLGALALHQQSPKNRERDGAAVAAPAPKLLLLATASFRNEEAAAWDMKTLDFAAEVDRASRPAKEKLRATSASLQALQAS